MKTKKILIVDDEAAFTRMMKLVLEKTGRYEVIYENKASQAVTTARACLPDLILLDVVMPDMDGGDVAALLQHDPLLKDIPIVFLTALVGGKESATGPVTRAGFRFLGKLVSDAELLKCIEENLRP
ncbi:MAG: response regulator [Kiritimatiellaeota bacterium]|nr:response regulator [Kiritimatiellota bacterium]